jgi:hypothetical protein
VLLIRSSTRGAPKFCQEVDLSAGAGAQVKRLLTYLKAESGRDDSILAQPILRKRFDDMLVDALLALPHDHSQEMAAGGNLPVAPYHVRRAEEYMRANSHKPFSIDDLLELCECSRSALFEGFQRFRGDDAQEIPDRTAASSRPEKAAAGQSGGLGGFCRDGLRVHQTRQFLTNVP